MARGRKRRGFWGDSSGIGSAEFVCWTKFSGAEKDRIARIRTTGEECGGGSVAEWPKETESVIYLAGPWIPGFPAQEFVWIACSEMVLYSQQDRSLLISPSGSTAG